MGVDRDGSASARLKRIQLLAEDLAAALRVEDVARVVVATAIATFGADAAGVWIIDGDVVRLIACDEAGHARLYSVVPLENGGFPVVKAVASGQAQWVETRADYAARFPEYEAATRNTPTMMSSFVVLPLATRQVHGAIAVAFHEERTFPAEEREFFCSLAGHASIAYERARLFDEAATRQRNAEAAAQRIEKLREAMEALTSARTTDDVARVTVESGRKALDSIAATMWFADAEGRLELAATQKVAPVVRPDLPIDRVIATRAPVFVEAEQGRQPYAVLPLATDERVLGAIAFTFAGTTHHFADDEREFLFGLTRTCEQALERARLLEVEAEARRVAEAASHRKDEFLAMLGHELRNPLAAMSAALELIKLREGGLTRELTIVDRHLAALVHMIGDLLDVSRVTLGKIQLARTSCDVKVAIDQAIENLHAQIEARAHALEVDVAEGLLVNADPERLSQVIENLIVNAVQYTPNGGRIRITGRADGDDVEIVVRDNGVGIASTLMTTIFDAFVQGPRTLDRRQGGLGIGLTLVKQLVEMHGGRVIAESAGEGHGSTFTVRWPRAARPSTAKMAKLSRPEPLRVLLVDREVEHGRSFARALEAMGHKVLVVHDDAGAREAGGHFAAEIVFLDLAVGGYQLAKELRAKPLLQAARVIALGPHGSRDEMRETESGVSLHANKPIDLVAIASLLD
jgi:signal transduction histidine kinase/CheY-like chemotaxis protein